VALFKVGESSYGEPWWGNDTNGADSGTFTLSAPTLPGQYEFRYLLNGGRVDRARSSPVTVLAE
jgi:hypothetical protein